MSIQTKYESPKIMTVDEALGLDEKKIKKSQDKLLEEVDIIDFVDAYRQDVERITVLNEELPDCIAAFRSGKCNREEIEGVYAIKILMLLHMARLFHPISKYGKEMLSEALACRLEFEESIGPLVSTITSKNLDLFSDLLTPDLAEDISVGKSQAIGAIRTSGDVSYGVGVIVFHTEESVVYEGGILRVEWLYVNPEYRERGVANHLIGELLNQMVDSGITHATAEYPVNSDANMLLTYILGEWKFELETGISPEALLQVHDISNQEKIHVLRKDVKSLSSLDEKTSMHVIKTSLRRFSYQGFLLNPNLKNGYIDRNLSCYIGEVTKPNGILLAHRMPSGKCRMEYFNVGLGHEKDIGRLLCGFMEAAITSSKDADLVEIPIEMMEMGVFLDNLSPKQMGRYLMEGFLTPPTSEVDLDKEDIEELINNF